MLGRRRTASGLCPPVRGECGSIERLECRGRAIDGVVSSDDCAEVVRNRVVAASAADAKSPPQKPEIRAQTGIGNLLAGVLGGVASTAVMHPIDLIKVRFQVQHRFSREAGAVRQAPQYTSLWGAVRSIAQQDGARGFFRGVTPAMAGSGLSWGSYFYLYEAARSRYLRAAGLRPGEHLSWWKTTLAALEGSVLTVLVTNPIWVVKTRMQLQSMAGGAGTASSPYTGLGHALRTIWHEEGVRGLYRGIVPALFLTSHGVIQFTVYEEMKRLTRDATPETEPARSMYHFALGAGSKLVATTATYPYQVMKSRLQARHSPYSGLLDAARTTAREEGLRAFFGGFSANLVRVIPGSAVTIAIYELFKPLASGGKSW